jgi:hypothetical protein
MTGMFAVIFGFVGSTLNYLKTFEFSFYRSKVAATLNSPYWFEVIIIIIIIIIIIDVAIRVDRNVNKKEAEKSLKYKDLTIEIQRMWNVKSRVIPVIIGETGTISKSFRKYASDNRKP